MLIWIKQSDENLLKFADTWKNEIKELTKDGENIDDIIRTKNQYVADINVIKGEIRQVKDELKKTDKQDKKAVEYFQTFLDNFEPFVIKCEKVFQKFDELIEKIKSDGAHSIEFFGCNEDKTSLEEFLGNLEFLITLVNKT